MRASLRLAQTIRTASLPLYHSCATASPSRDREGTVVMETVRFDDDECASALENIETVMRAVCRDPDTLRTSPGKPRFSPLRGRGHPCISTLYIIELDLTVTGPTEASADFSMAFARV